MLNFIQKMTELILDIQDGILKKNTTSNIYSNTVSKKVYSSCATLSFDTKTSKVKEKIEANLENLILKHKSSPEKLLSLVEKNGTKIYRIKFAKNLLKLVSQETGLVAANYGLKALFINTITKQGCSFKSEPVFILDEKNTLDKYRIFQQVYKWYGMKMNLAGFDAKSQDNFNKYIVNNTMDINNLSIEEIIGLKEAIARDVEAINFVVKMSKSTDSSKRVLQKMIETSATV